MYRWDTIWSFYLKGMMLEKNKNFMKGLKAFKGRTACTTEYKKWEFDHDNLT